MTKHILTHFKKADPLFYVYCEQIDISLLQKSNTLFADLCDHIISQQLSVKAGATILSRFITLFPKKELSPEFLLTLPDQKIRDVGISFAKISYLKNLAQTIVNKELDLEILPTLPNDTIIQELTKVKGIGVWTAEMFLMSSLGREDVFSYGDLGLKRAIQKIYKLEKEPTKEEAEAISRKWSPYRTYACKILWKVLPTLS